MSFMSEVIKTAIVYAYGAEYLVKNLIRRERDDGWSVDEFLVINADDKAQNVHKTFHYSGGFPNYVVDKILVIK
jgi:hypothetical protein